MRRKSRQVALCGLLGALSVVFLTCGSIIPLATFYGPILAMLALLPILEEYGPKAALSAYAAVAVLGLLLVPDKEVACFYLFFGYYPVLRPALNRIRFRLLRVLVKLCIFNAAILSLYGLLLFVFQLPLVSEDFAGLSRLMLALLLAAGNGTFLLLDRVLLQLTLLYRHKLRKRWFR